MSDSQERPPLDVDIGDIVLSEIARRGQMPKDGIGWGLPNDLVERAITRLTAEGYLEDRDGNIRITAAGEAWLSHRATAVVRLDDRDTRSAK